MSLHSTRAPTRVNPHKNSFHHVVVVSALNSGLFFWCDVFPLPEWCVRISITITTIQRARAHLLLRAFFPRALFLSFASPPKYYIIFSKRVFSSSDLPFLLLVSANTARPRSEQYNLHWVFFLQTTIRDSMHRIWSRFGRDSNREQTGSNLWFLLSSGLLPRTELIFALVQDQDDHKLWPAYWFSVPGSGNY